MRSIIMAPIRMPAVAAIVIVAGGFGAAAAQEQNMPGSMDPERNGQGATMCRMDEHIDGQLAYLETRRRPRNGVSSPTRSVSIRKKCAPLQVDGERTGPLEDDVRQFARIARDDGSAFDGAARIISLRPPAAPAKTLRLAVKGDLPAMIDPPNQLRKVNHEKTVLANLGTSA